MLSKITLGQAGRLVIPKSVRDELHLAAGDALELESKGEEIMLRPLRPKVSLKKERGIWVLRTGKPMPAPLTDEVLQDIRAERDAQNLGQE